VALEVPVFGQRASECGNTSLKAVLWFHGLRLSARRLGRMVGLSELGTDHGGLVRGALAAGARAFERTGGTPGELRWFARRGYPVIVGWWSREEDDAHFDPRWPLAERRARDCGHYSVVTGVTGRRVSLVDPQWRLRRGRRRVVGHTSMPRAAFLSVWYDTDGPRYRRIDRWYLVVHRSDLRFATRFPGTDHLP
jgi:hypothetical protein